MCQENVEAVAVQIRIALVASGTEPGVEATKQSHEVSRSHYFKIVNIYSQYVLELAPMDGAFIARCGGLASDGPKIGPDFATAPMVPPHADAPWFGHWFGHFTRRRCRDVTST